MNSSLILNQPGFVLGNARVLAGASQAAYGAGNYAETPHVVAYAKNQSSAHMLVWEYADCTVVAFRGTAALRDWITDAEFPLRPLPGSGGRVHAGFLAAVESVRGDLMAGLRGGPAMTWGQAVPAPMVLTGHSLGGALAVLAAWFLQQEGFAVHSVYTFGQPRVGDRAFAAAYQTELGERTYRVVNQNDIVPRVPGVLLGYRHAGELPFVNALGELVMNPSWVGRVVSDAVGLYRAYRQMDEVLVGDHFMGRYVAALDGVGEETSNSKIQTSEKLQAPSANLQTPGFNAAR